uniref:E3 ubiquitin ligase n=1 Tax=Melanopsichium pennsylvanicum 4 TaxID=1398559 RepID=A0A077QQE7_9BASI|nr:e3 ubiquitin ligase [Melanopsichium pennsylvanicum 4]
MPPNTFLSWVTRPRIYAYSIISTLAAISTVSIAFSERSNFYAAVVFLGRSNGCLLVLLNFLLVIALAAGRILQLLYFGQLRRSEVELVCERSWYSLVGTLLAVSIFRDDFSVSFVILFGVLLFLKIFHWLSAERVASIMQTPSVPRIFHVRMVSILSTLLLADLMLIGFSLHMLLVKKTKVGMMVLFTSEFIILTALLLNTIAQYILNCVDMAREEPWEAKSLYMLYVDLAHDVVRLCTHGYFFVLLTRLYGIPLSLIHDLYSAGRSCMLKVKALIRYRAAVKMMETKYPNATAADLMATDALHAPAASTADGPSSTANTSTPAEQAYDNRLQAFLSRLQSDLRKVRQEGNLSAQSASTSRQRTSRSGNSTPRSTAANSAIASGVLPNSIFSGVGRQSRSSEYGLAGAIFPSTTGHGVGEENDLGGLWMPPPPSTLYSGGMRPQWPSNSSAPMPKAVSEEEVEGTGTGKGKGKAVESTSDNDEESTDPMDPREAIRQATLKRFGQLNPSTSSYTTTCSSSTSSLQPQTQSSLSIGMIPLFDPTQIPDFDTHLENLPHPLLPNTLAQTRLDLCRENLTDNDDDDDAEARWDAILESKKSGVRDQIVLLTRIQSRIDHVIKDLSTVLDIVASSSHSTNNYDTSTEHSSNQA